MFVFMRAARLGLPGSTLTQKLFRSEWRRLLPELGHRGDPAGVTIHFKIHQLVTSARRAPERLYLLHLNGVLPPRFDAARLVS
jgi:hypothetical protein